MEKMKRKGMTEKEFCRMIVFVIYCCVTNCHKFEGLKSTHRLTDSVGKDEGAASVGWHFSVS